MNATLEGMGAPSGDMVVDFLVLAGVWPREVDPYQCSYYRSPLPGRVENAAMRFALSLRDAREYWREVPPSMGNHCRLVLADRWTGARTAVVPMDRLFELPGLEDYQWDGRGPLWYSSNLVINSFYFGPVLFMHDGWIGPDPARPSRLRLNPWDDYVGAEWPLEGEEEGDGCFHTMMKLGDVTLAFAIDTTPAWAPWSFEVATLVLEQIFSVVHTADPRMADTIPVLTEWSEDAVRNMVRGELYQEFFPDDPPETP